MKKMRGKKVNLYEVKEQEREFIQELKKEFKNRGIKYWIEPETISSIIINEKVLFEQYIKALHEFVNFLTSDKVAVKFRFNKWNIEKDSQERIIFWSEKYKKDNNYNKVMVVIIEIKNMSLRHKIFKRKK